MMRAEESAEDAGKKRRACEMRALGVSKGAVEKGLQRLSRGPWSSCELIVSIECPAMTCSTART